MGLSLANVGAGLTGTFVVNGSPTKTQMVDSAGGRSQLAQITTSVIVLLVLLFLTRPLEFMPDVVLSTVVFLIGLDLIDVSGMRQIFLERPAEFWVALITAVIVVFVGVKQGIVLAMFLSLVSHTRHGYRPQNALIVPAQPEGWKTEPVATQAQFLPGLLVYRFTHGMYYANAEQSWPRKSPGWSKEAKPPLVWFCIDAAAVDDIDLHRGRNFALPPCHPPEAGHKAGIFRGLGSGLCPTGTLGDNRPGRPGCLLCHRGFRWSRAYKESPKAAQPRTTRWENGLNHDVKKADLSFRLGAP